MHAPFNVRTSEELHSDLSESTVAASGGCLRFAELRYASVLQDRHKVQTSSSLALILSAVFFHVSCLPHDSDQWKYIRHVRLLEELGS